MRVNLGRDHEAIGAEVFHELRHGCGWNIEAIRLSDLIRAMSFLNANSGFGPSPEP
jgi:hypothetical protein